MSQYCTEDQFVFDDAQDDFGFADSISGPLPISMGGTGAESAAGALQNLLLPLPVSDDPLDESARVPYLAAGSPMAPQARRAEDLAGDLWTMLPKDAAPTEGSENAVTSGAVAEAIAAVQEDLDEKLLAAYVTDTASGSIASFPDGADGVPVKALTVNVEPVQTGTGDASPENQRPISGRTQANVMRTGKNLLKNIGVGSKDRGITSVFNDDGTVTLSGTNDGSSYSRFVLNGYFQAENGVEYTMSGAIDSKIVIRNVGAGISDTGNGINFTGTGSSQNIEIRVLANTVISGSVVIKPMIRLASSTDSAYEPYQGDTYTIQLGQTVYGGTLDVTGQKMLAGRAIVDLGTGDWKQAGSANYFYSAIVASGIKRPETTNTPTNILCSALTPTTANRVDVASGNLIGIATNGNIRCRFDGMPTTTAEFKAAVSGMMLCYELATPIEIDLSDIPEITTLYGDNCIWSDAGDVTVEYRADTALYIQKLTGSTESDMIADANIPTNTYFMIGNTLYLSTAAIAQGETIVPGTNCTQTNLAAALNALNT